MKSLVLRREVIEEPVGLPRTILAEEELSMTLQYASASIQRQNALLSLQSHLYQTIAIDEYVSDHASLPNSPCHLQR